MTIMPSPSSDTAAILGAVLCFLVCLIGPIQVVAQDRLDTRNGALEMLSLSPLAGKAVMDSEKAFEVLGQEALFNGKYHLVLEFDHILSSEDRERLASNGVTLDHFLPETAYVARVASDSDFRDLLELGLQAAGRPTLEHKIAPEFLDFLGRTTDDKVMVRAGYSPGTDPTDVVGALTMVGNISDVEIRDGAFYFTANMSSEAIRTVAKLPFVQVIEPHGEPVLEEGAFHQDDYDENIIADVQATHIRANVLTSTLPDMLGLSGQGVVAGLGDAVYQGGTHMDLRGRHSILDPGLGNNGSFSQHGNHTTSILAGDGSIRPRFKGVAPKATVYTMRTGDFFQLGLDQPNPMVISSNSWNSSDPVYGDWYEQKGRYNVNSQAIDLLLANERQLLSVFSAGNSGATQTNYPPNYLTLNPSYGSAKNTLVVGRMGHPVFASVAPSYGPARDGRIKPDIVAQNNVHSAIAFNDYATYQGSSQSTPAISGAAALLVEHYRNLHSGQTPDGALIKSILMNTADYVLVDGPTFASGYGLANARRAAEVITESQFQISEVENGNQVDISIPVPDQIDGKSISRLKVMLYWTDKEASPYAGPALVNNLDLVVADASGDHLPWVLDVTPARADQPATRGVDALNNVEQVVIDSPGSGTVTARVTGSAVPFGPQTFYLVYSYVLDELIVTHPMGGEQFFSGQNKVVFWDSPYLGAAANVDDVAYSLDGMNTWISFHGNSTAVRSASILPVPETPLTEAYVRVTRGAKTAIGGPFVISERLDLTLDTSGSGSPTVTWNPVAGAASYELLALSADNTWDVVHSTAETAIAWDDSYGTGRESWLSVRAVDASGSIRSQRADAVQYVSSNAIPVAIPDEVSVSTGGFVSINPLSNDSDGDGDVIYITQISGASNGTATLRDDQRVLYFPNSGFAGAELFTYTVSDGMGGTATGTILVSVVSGVATEQERQLPAQVLLEPNYPNPFNPVTTIQFALPGSSKVDVRVFDMLGRQVATLANGQYQAGWHQVRFDASTLASGVYFYQLKTPQASLIRSMLVLK
jgi:hypothetical protein